MQVKNAATTAGEISQVLAGNKEFLFSVSLEKETLFLLGLVLLCVFAIAWIIILTTGKYAAKA